MGGKFFNGCHQSELLQQKNIYNYIAGCALFGKFLKKVQGQNQNMLPPPPKKKGKIWSLAYVLNGVSHLEWCFSFAIVKKSIMSRTRVENTIFGGIKTAFSKFTY